MFEHIALYYDLRVQVYTEVCEHLGANVSHIADYMLERWWTVFAESHNIEIMADEAEMLAKYA